MPEFNPQIVSGPSLGSFPNDLYVDLDGDQQADLVISTADFDNLQLSTQQAIDIYNVIVELSQIDSIASNSLLAGIVALPDLLIFGANDRTNADFGTEGLCCTNRLIDRPPLTPDGFMQWPRFSECPVQ